MFAGVSRAEENLDSVHESVLLVEGDSGSGSAFVVSVDGSQYIYTNAHVLAWQKKVVFRSMNGNVISHGEVVEVAEEKDIARIPLKGAPFKVPLHLVANAEVKLGEEVVAYGNSGGEGVITSLEGEILGVGPLEIEVSSEIIPGNSDGPIVRKGTTTVLGIATRGQASASPWAAETRFEDIRRFGLRAEASVKWKKSTFKTIAAEADKIESINIDSVSIMALSILTATQRGLYIPDDLEVGPNGKVSVKVTDPRQSTNGVRAGQANPLLNPPRRRGKPML